MKTHERHIRIIQLIMRSYQPISSKVIYWDVFDFEHGGVPKRTIQRDLQKLVGVGLLERLGNVRSITYLISNRAHRDLVDISISYERERIEFEKYRLSGIAPRFSFPNMHAAVSWMIRRAFLASECRDPSQEEGCVRGHRGLRGLKGADC